MAQVRKTTGSGDFDSFPLVAVKVGDFVGFKSDFEQYGTIVAIEGEWLTLESSDRFEGDYIGGKKRTTEHASDCWLG